jgi:hypothetical protein
VEDGIGEFVGVGSAIIKGYSRFFVANTGGKKVGI